MKKFISLALLLFVGVILCEISFADEPDISLGDARVRKYISLLGDKKHSQEARVGLVGLGRRRPTLPVHSWQSS